MTDETVQAIGLFGSACGVRAGEWIEFRDDDHARRCLALDNYGDPAWWDEFGVRDPLSGEYADDLTPRALALEFGIDQDDTEAIEEACNIFEDAYVNAAHQAVIRRAHYMVSA